MSKELLQQAIDFAEYCLEELELSYMASNQAKRLIEKSEEALAKQEQLGEPVAFFDWYDNAHWGNEDFKESCHRSWNAAIKYTTPQPKQEQGEPVAWKLVPIEPTREMLDAMDECSMEGYDERLYAGHAASVYMAAVDVAPTQPQRKEPEQEPDGYVQKVIDALYENSDPVSVEAAELLERMTQPEQDGQCKRCTDGCPACDARRLPEQEPVACIEDGDLYFANEIDWQTLQKQGISVQLLYTTPPQRKPLSDEEIILIVAECASSHQHTDIHLARAIEASHGIKE